MAPVRSIAGLVAVFTFVHGVPAETGTTSQRPVEGLHSPVPHWSSSPEQSMGVGSQTPATQVPGAQRSPESQAPPSFAATSTHASCVSSQTTSSHSLPLRPQSLGRVPTQTPAPSQASPRVQKRPSSQGVPASAGTSTQAPTGPS